MNIRVEMTIDVRSAHSMEEAYQKAFNWAGCYGQLPWLYADGTSSPDQKDTIRIVKVHLVQGATR